LSPSSRRKGIPRRHPAVDETVSVPPPAFVPVKIGSRLPPRAIRDEPELRDVDRVRAVKPDRRLAADLDLAQTPVAEDASLNQSGVASAPAGGG